MRMAVSVEPSMAAAIAKTSKAMCLVPIAIRMKCNYQWHEIDIDIMNNNETTVMWQCSCSILSSTTVKVVMITCSPTQSVSAKQAETAGRHRCPHFSEYDCRNWGCSGSAAHHKCLCWSPLHNPKRSSLRFRHFGWACRSDMILVVAIPRSYPFHTRPARMDNKLSQQQAGQSRNHAHHCCQSTWTAEKCWLWQNCWELKNAIGLHAHMHRTDGCELAMNGDVAKQWMLMNSDS